MKCYDNGKKEKTLDSGGFFYEFNSRVLFKTFWCAVFDLDSDTKKAAQFTGVKYNLHELSFPELHQDFFSCALIFTEYKLYV